MAKRFVIGAAVLVMGCAGAAGAQEIKGLSPADVAAVARTRALDLRISPQADFPRPHRLVDGMIVNHELAPNATLGLGLANIYGRKKAGSDVRITGGSRGSRKPAVKFVLRFR
jgi:hypothetical protein